MAAVYYGPVLVVQPYFEGLGHTIPPHMNPADAFMDIVATTGASGGGGASMAQGQVRAIRSWGGWEVRCGALPFPCGFEQSLDCLCPLPARPAAGQRSC